MPNMWTTSGEREIPPEMAAEKQRLEAEVAAIDAVRRRGRLSRLREPREPDRGAHAVEEGGQFVEDRARVD